MRISRLRVPLSPPRTERAHLPRPIAPASAPTRPFASPPSPRKDAAREPAARSICLPRRQWLPELHGKANSGRESESTFPVPRRRALGSPTVRSGAELDGNSNSLGVRSRRCCELSAPPVNGGVTQSGRTPGPETATPAATVPRRRCWWGGKLVAKGGLRSRCPVFGSQWGWERSQGPSYGPPRQPSTLPRGPNPSA